MTWPIVISTLVLAQLVHEPMVCMVAQEKRLFMILIAWSHTC